MKQIIYIFIFSAFSQCLKSQVPCYGISPSSSCCNDIINTDVIHKVNKERPTFTNTWDWTVPNFTNSLKSSIFNLSTIKNPYFECNGTNISAIWGRDIPQTSWTTLTVDSFPNLNPRRGWQVLSYNFGKDYLGNIDTNTNEAKDPYFIIYNKYTGQLRILFTIENNSGYHNRTNTYFGFPQTSNNSNGINGTPSGNIMGSGLFSMYKDPIQTLDEVSNPWIMSPAPSNGGTQWSVADYTLQYDPCVCSNNSEILFWFNNFKTDTLILSGRGQGIISPFNRNGSNPAIFGKDFMNQVSEGFRSDGNFMMNSADALANTLYIPPIPWYDMLIRNGLNSAFNAALTSGLGFGTSYLSKALSSEITPWINQSVKNNRDFAWAIRQTGLQGDTIGGITQYKDDAVAGALAGFLGTATSGFSMQLFDTKESGPTNYFFNEFELKMVGISTNETKGNRNKIHFQNPGSLNSNSLNIPIRSYPLYNEPLGLFAMLRKPKIKRRANYYKNETAVAHKDWKGAVPFLGFFADKTYFTFSNNSNKLEYEVGSDIEFALNPSAEIDYEKTQISAAWKIPIVYKKSCGGECNSYVSKDGDKIVASLLGSAKPFCEYLSDTVFNLTPSRNFIKISNSNFNQDTVYYSTPYIPIEHFKNMRFSYDFEQRACSEFTDVPEGIRLSLLIHYVFKPNAYGEVNEHFQTMDYGVNVETTTNFSKSIYRYPINSTIVLGPTVFTKDTTIYADSIVIIGNLSTTNGAVIRIIATKPITHLSGAIDPTISLYQGTIYPANTIVPLNEVAVKSFCGSPDYKAKAYPYSNKAAIATKDKNDSIIDISIVLYPNPSNANTTLKINNMAEGEVYIRIYDMMGKLVMGTISHSVSSNNDGLELSTQNIAKGIYLVEVSNKDVKKTIKFIKE